MMMNKYKEALDKMCSNCRIGAIEQGYKRGCAFVDIDNSRCDEYEALQELVEKATPKKVLKKETNREEIKVGNITFKTLTMWYCPNCGEWIAPSSSVNNCGKCGQALDWGEKE